MSGTVVVQTAWLGDVVLTTPLLDALAARHGPVGVVTTPAAAALVETHPAVARVHRYDKRRRDRGATGLARVAAALRHHRYQSAVHPQMSWRSALLTWGAGIPRRIGFSSAPARWLYTRRVAGAGTHEAERLLSLAETGGPSIPTLHLTPADHAAADGALEACGVTRPFAVLAPDAARPNKRWPYYGDLAERLCATMDVVLVGAAGMRPVRQDRRTPRPPGRGVTDLSGLPIRVSAAVLSRAAVAVTNDSAPLHLAQAVGTPVVAVFGPTAPAFGFGPRGPHDAVVALPDLACRPCSAHGGQRCPRGHHRCLRDLPVHAVANAVEQVLGRVAAPCA